jgi:hypothetical protein
MLLKAVIEIEMEVSDFYSAYDATILCKEEISEQLKGMNLPERVTFNRNFVNVIHGDVTPKRT